MNKVYIVYFIVTLISFTGSDEQNGEHFLTINGETYDISPTENHIEIDSILNHTLGSLNHTRLNSPNSDAFVDLILAGARKLIKDKGLDPADLPDAIAKFSKKILGIKVWGEAKVRNTFSKIIMREKYILYIWYLKIMSFQLFW